jgi:acetyl-CoA carboxylase biotin carboxyl carrier protein
MTDPADSPMTQETSATGIDDLTDSILPALIARLRASRLGELEVRTPDWRVRLRRDLAHARRTAHTATGDAAATDDDDRDGSVARSPAVGYFSPVGDLVVGQLVQAGDALGSVDVLGIAQDVVAPTGGIVRAVLVEPGQAVEYGQHLVEIDALALESSASDAAEAGAGPDIADAGA